MSSQLINQILMRVLSRNNITGTNAQKLLDSHWFTELSLEEQIEFIQAHRAELARNPKFDWGSVAEGAIGLGAMSAISTLGYQLTNRGIAGIRTNPFGVIGAGVLGATVGGMMEYRNSKSDFNKDLETKNNIDDAIEVLIRRDMRPGINRLNLADRIKRDVLDAPVSYGKRLSDHSAFYESEEVGRN